MQERSSRGRGLISRRQFLVGAGAGAVLLGTGACGPQQQGSQPAPTEGVPEMPDRPVNLSIIDVAGNLQLTRSAIEDYVSNRSDVV